MNRAGLVITVLALVFLVFIAGAVTTRFELFPYGYLQNSFKAAEALLERETGEKIPIAFGAKPIQPEDSSSPAVRDTQVGLAKHSVDRAYNGYTIYTPVRSDYPIRLIDMQGETAHQWTVPFEQLGGPRQDGLQLNPPEELVTIASPRLFANGDLLVVLGVARYTPWGLGVIKLDKDSNLIWKYMRQAHHDLDVDASGNIYALTHRVIQTPWPGLERIQTPFIDDEVVILNSKGEEQALVSVLEAIQNSPYVSMLQYARPDRPKGDLLHVNSITYLDAGKAAALPNAEPGDVLISLRQIAVVAVLDVQNRTIKWAHKGPWFMQHDPDVLANGNLLVFDNRGDLANGGTSRILELNPFTQEIVWEYPGKRGDRLYSSIYGSQQRLLNGNTLIAESNNGRLLEVDYAGDIVWDYRIPERKIDGNGKMVATAVFAERFTEAQLSFLD